MTAQLPSDHQLNLVLPADLHQLPTRFLLATWQEDISSQQRHVLCDLRLEWSRVEVMYDRPLVISDDIRSNQHGNLALLHAQSKEDNLPQESRIRFALQVVRINQLLYITVHMEITRQL